MLYCVYGAVVLEVNRSSEAVHSNGQDMSFGQIGSKPDMTVYQLSDP